MYGYKKYITEFLGSVLGMYVLLTSKNYLAIGAALSLASFLGGTISGGAFNPAVSLALLYDGKMKNIDIIPYIISQILGAMVALFLSKIKFV
jgi:aquaporin Z